jgi:hypothetical protein
MTKKIFYGLLILLFFSIPLTINFYVNYLWFQNLHFEEIFTKMVMAQIFSGIIGGIGVAGIIYINLIFAIHATRQRNITIWDEISMSPQPDFLKNIDKFILLIPLIIGFFSILFFANNWLAFLKYFNAVQFGSTDPILGKDISFYFFIIPVWQIIANTLLFIFGFSFILSILNYIAKGSILFNRERISVEKIPKIHLSVLGSIIFLVLAFKAYINIPMLFYSSQGIVAGANYVEVNAIIPALKIQMIIAIFIAIFILINIFLKQRLILLGSIGIYLAVWLIGGVMYPAILQKFVVGPNELVKETPYIKYNIAATRKAFDLYRVEERRISGVMNITKDSIERNGATIKNIRLWDHKPLLDTFSQIQEIRTYYYFSSVDNDRYIIDGEYRQIMLSPRELSSESLPTRNWINERLTFTHGYGLTLGPVNQVTPEGLPVLMIKDIPPVSTVSSLKIVRPEIYFGELSSDYVIVNTKAKEFDYPSGEKNVFTVYSGKRGILMNSFFRRLCLSIYFKSFKLLLSNDITQKSKILFKRNITERVRRIMPFLILDSDPYMVISDNGHLFWIYDAYTVSKRFPYSQPLKNGINYIRNSVKITINAYDGSVNFYIADKSDPIVNTISKIFPNSFKPISKMPADLKRHIRYPQDIFSIQTVMYSTYHMQDPQIFYNKEDQWDIPFVIMGSANTQITIKPYHIIMKLPGEDKEEFILMLPFTPRNKNNLSAWMVARSDGKHYGKMIVYKFPKDRLVYGPKQIMARINQNPEISRQISLWDQRGSEVIQGTLLIIPIEGALIYVQPLYLRAETGKIPELKRVIVAYENRIAMGKTLDIALSKIFGKIEAPKPSKEGITLKDLTQKAIEHYELAIKAQRNGNWALYGEEIKKLGEILKRMIQ